MAAEYTITLSDGTKTTLATLYPLEVNGPDNLSTPRSIIGVVDGGAGTGSFDIHGDMTGRFVAGFTFDVQNSGGNDGTYTVLAGGSTFAADVTTIPVVEAVPSAGLPLGQIQYTNPDANTSLKLPGKGSMNVGEFFTENMVRMLENFASPTSPDANATITGAGPTADPLEGQWWYKNDTQEFYFYDGVSWTLFQSGGTAEWRAPVVVRDDTNYANSAAFPVGGTIDGVALAVDDRVLFSNVTAAADEDIWVWNGASWVAADDLVAVAADRVGSVVYVKEGTNAHQLVAFADNSGAPEWQEVSGAGGGGGTFFLREQQTAGVGQTIFNLTNAYKPTVDGSRLLVFVDGVKYIYGVGYTENNETTVTLSPPAPFVGTEEVEFYSLVETTSVANISYGSSNGHIGNPTITLPGGMTYVTNGSSLLVYLNGQKMVVGTDFTETSSTQIAWIGTPLVAPDVLEFYSAVPVTAGTQLSDVDNVSGTAPVNGQILVYNNGTGLWEPQTPGPSGGIEDGVLFDELNDGVLGNGPTVFNTVNATTTAKALTLSYIQVFMNGVLQKEGVTDDYQVTGPNQITFNVPVPPGADVTVYQL